MGNGFYIENTYDELDRVIETKYNGNIKFTYVYNGNGQLYSMTDAINNTTTYYEYDGTGKLVRAREMSSTTKKLGVQNIYDTFGRIYQTRYDIGSIAHEYSVTYRDDSSLVTNINMPNSAGISYTYDHFDRFGGSTLTQGAISILTKGYSYLDGIDDTTTTFIESETFNGSNTKYTYEYDDNGNIIKIYFGDDTVVLILSYEYDEFNQLIRENNTITDETYVYEYFVKDAYDVKHYKNGNIQAKYIFDYDATTATDSLNYTLATKISYSYNNSNWGDLLTTYNGTNISYDNIGNPTNWRNMAVITWQGRELSSFWDTGYNTEHQYRYNESGIRTNKYIEYWSLYDYTNISYVLDGTKILKETRTGSENATLYYYYDDTGSITGFTYNGTNYYYGKNIQGDIKYIYNASGALLAEYCYDAWGNLVKLKDASGNDLTSGTYYDLANLNPFRYRSYYYDYETGFYYLNSRYYDPQVGRFINADGIIGANQDLQGYNLFAYCSNNPVMYVDPNGNQKIAVIYDSRTSGYFFGLFGGKGFEKQGKWMIDNLKKAGNEVIACPFTTIEEFISQWNSLNDKYDAIYIYSHGTSGASIDCAGKQLLPASFDSEYSYNDLDMITMNENGVLYLFCCNGGVKRSGLNTSTAEQFSIHISCGKVIAAIGKISFEFNTGKPKIKNGYWSSVYSPTKFYFYKRPYFPTPFQYYPNYLLW